jgi:hypothetical protein
MSNINNSELRIGRFTSSNNYKLCKSLKSGQPTKAFYTYAKEKKHEKKMGRSGKVEKKVQATKWGSLLEVVLFDLLGLEYSMGHKDTMLHPEYGEFWSGTPDLIVTDVKAGEIKCPEPARFANLEEALLSEDTEKIKEEDPEAYWQVISNALICGVDRAEIIAYMPYKTELLEIIEKVESTNFLERNGLDPQDYYFLTRNDIESLPYLPDDSPMSNINSFEFEVPKEDAEFLTERIIEASKLI